jgi:hypothetical protein
MFRALFRSSSLPEKCEFHDTIVSFVAFIALAAIFAEATFPEVPQ